MKHLAVGYHYPVLSNIEFSIKGGQKVVITGFNGIGKSTLLKTLIGEIPSIQGHFKFSDQVTIGYFEQDLEWQEPELTPIQIVANAYPNMVTKDVRKHLARCGISSKHAMQAIGTLSGGEQAKVKMCLLTLTPCNFLIMDEPTNHLDVQAKEALKTALMAFVGTVLLVSHEESFYRDWTQRVISIEKISLLWTGYRLAGYFHYPLIASIGAIISRIIMKIDGGNLLGKIIILSFSDNENTLYSSIISVLASVADFSTVAASTDAPLLFGSLQIDPQRRLVWQAGQTVDLTPMEFDILLLLARRPGQVFSLRQIYEAVATDSYDASWTGISSMVYKLRRKLGASIIETVYGRGYRFPSK